jgi:hypothetical protein
VGNFTDVGLKKYLHVVVMGKRVERRDNLKYLGIYVMIQLELLFSCRIAGYKSVSGRSCDRPLRHRFFLVSLCLNANAEMVPKTPSCYCMLLM